METIAELLESKGVSTLEELESKIKTEAQAATLLSVEEQKAGLKKQIADLETIKAAQGDEVGTLRKDLADAKEKLEKMDVGKNAEDADSPTGKTPEQWATENAQAEKALTDADWNKLDTALKNAPEETRKLAIGSEEGRAAFRNAILGSDASPEQETFRRPVQKKKLSVEEQIKAGLGLLKPNTAPTLRPSGSGFNPNQPNQKKPAPMGPRSNSGSILDRIKATNGE